ncbi:hypothetical protein JOF48_001604 [Arthrobacter stackebrandtii]|uniref:Uncharacterized protein n=1 Tax=Arthrobacter stackebrandtii TaxID=272161 RepID=A0ABS4YWE7_9MICC|nr:hypothetical protein [Arthrobacter stackebrandtii]MBP2412805.1 hypothetical protein [Arthrobacter stackebrandtii]
MRKLLSGITLLVTICLGGLFVTPAANAASAGLAGTVNCNGSWATYSTVRKTTQYGTSFYLAQAAGSAGNLVYKADYSMNIGMYIVAIGVNHNKYYAGAGRNYTLQNAGYVLGTRFTMQAQMAPSHGTCSNTWNGTLSY